MSGEQAAPGGAGERERRVVWVIDTDALAPVEAEALSCAPGVPGYWFVPQIGYSLSERHLYATEEAATEEALKECGAAIVWHRKREEDLLARREQLRLERCAGAGEGEGE